MSVHEAKSGKTACIYELLMSNDEITEVTVYAGNETEKSTYIEHFLMGRDFFVDDKTKGRYNKAHIISCKEKV